MGSISIVHDDPYIDQCGYCDNGIQGDRYCRYCNGDGVTVFDYSDLATLAHNLAIAGGLCRAHKLGAGFGYEWATREPFYPRWEPGCGSDAALAEEARRKPGAFADIYGSRENWRVGHSIPRGPQGGE
jgi:hypothetical protein